MLPSLVCATSRVATKETILSQQQNRKPFNYLNKKKNKGGGGPPPQQHKQFTRMKPDSSIHVPPIAMYLLGGLGVVFGFGANCWQWFTTFSAMMDIMTPNGTRVSNASQPLKYVVAAIIATAMQFGILLFCSYSSRSIPGGRRTPTARTSARLTK